MILKYILCAVIAYLLGSISTGILVSQKAGHNLRQEGSHNTGASNALRVLGSRHLSHNAKGHRFHIRVPISQSAQRFSMLPIKILCIIHFLQILRRYLAKQPESFRHKKPLFSAEFRAF